MTVGVAQLVALAWAYCSLWKESPRLDSLTANLRKWEVALPRGLPWNPGYLGESFVWFQVTGWCCHCLSLYLVY
jgi:hypothetical protein